MDCYCDYGVPDFYTKSRPIARKKHKCDECGSTIWPGDRYEKVAGKWDEFQTFKTCVHCLAVRDVLEANMECFCWSHGGFWEEINEWWDYTELPPGIRFKVNYLKWERANSQKVS